MSGVWLNFIELSLNFQQNVILDWTENDGFQGVAVQLLSNFHGPAVCRAKSW